MMHSNSFPEKQMTIDRNSGRRYLDGVSHELQDLVHAGQKIAAFKLARETMGLGLKEAEKWVEELEIRMQEGTRCYLDDVPRELQDLIYAGQKIAAVKLAREKKNWGLKEAKEQVEKVEARLREQYPEGFAAGAGKSGCSTALVLVGVLVGCGIYLLTR